MDGKDKLAVATAAFCVLVIAGFSFLPWVRVSWNTGDASGIQTVDVAAKDLGAMTYICLAIVIAALPFTLASLFLRGAFAALDYGVVLIAAGVLFVALFFATIASNARFLGAALEELGRGGSSLPAQFDRKTLWPAYIMPIAGAGMALAGWVRLLERKGAVGPGYPDTRGGG
jgi:hypothetical protein